MNKYYATITIKVLINADDKDESNEILASVVENVTETVDRDADATSLEVTYKITDVK